MRLTKTTEAVGYCSVSFDHDVIMTEDPRGGSLLVGLYEMIPEGSIERRGRWRITVEFESEGT